MTTDELFEDYRQRLRAATATLPADVRDELLDDVEAHLAEVRASSPTPDAARAALDRLGSPEEVAAASHAEIGTPATHGPGAGTEAGGWPAHGAAAGAGGWVAGGGPGAGGGPATYMPPSGMPMAPMAPAGSGGVATYGVTPDGRPARMLGSDLAAVLLTLLSGPAGAVLMLAMGLMGLLFGLAGWITGLVLLWRSRTWAPGWKLLATVVFPGGPVLPVLLPLLVTRTCTSVNGLDVCDGFALAPAIGIPVMILTLLAPFAVAGILLYLARGSRRMA